MNDYLNGLVIQLKTQDQRNTSNSPRLLKNQIYSHWCFKTTLMLTFSSASMKREKLLSKLQNQGQMEPRWQNLSNTLVVLIKLLNVPHKPSLSAHCSSFTTKPIQSPYFFPSNFQHIWTLFSFLFILATRGLTFV